MYANYSSRERAKESRHSIGDFFEHFEGFPEHGITVWNKYKYLNIKDKTIVSLLR